jgi:predicted lactoylglutathione lyase
MSDIQALQFRYDLPSPIPLAESVDRPGTGSHLMTESFATRQPVTIALPTADRRTTFDFYAGGLGFQALGDPAKDGVPEPLQFALNDGVRVMFIPTGGFGWVTGNRTTATSEQSECLLVLTLADQRELHSLVDRARGAGAEIVMEPGEQQWGYTAVFADPDGHLWQLTSASSKGPFAQEG